MSNKLPSLTALAQVRVTSSRLPRAKSKKDVFSLLPRELMKYCIAINFFVTRVKCLCSQLVKYRGLVRGLQTSNSLGIPLASRFRRGKV